MKNLRYRLVTSLAILLTLALGVVVGTAALNGPALQTSQQRVDDLAQEELSLPAQADDLRSRLHDESSFQEAVAPALVRGKLPGRRVVLLIVGDTPPAGAVEGIRVLLSTAGARVTGTLRLQVSYSNPASAAEQHLAAWAALADNPTSAGSRTLGNDLRHGWCRLY